MINKNSYKIWYRNSTDKILQDYHYDDLFKEQVKQLKVYSAKNEYESFQILITPNKDINAYQIVVHDLYCKNERFNKENIEILNQKYVEVPETSPRQSHNLTGFYPDALLPMDVAIEYGENKINKANNQGIWLSIYTPTNQKPGVYKGTIDLMLDNETESINIEIEVWDFSIDHKIHSKSSFNIYDTLIPMYEYDASINMFRTYIDKLMKFRMAPYRVLPTFNSNKFDSAAYIEELRYVIKNSKYDLSTIMLPMFELDSKIDETKYKDIILKLVHASIEDKENYFERAAVFMGFIDEPHLNNTWDKTNIVSLQYETIKNEVADKVLEIYEQTEFLNELVKSMRKVGSFVTGFKDERLSNVKNWCVHFRNLRTEKERSQYSNGEQADWCYTCNGWGDVPTLTIDHKLIDARLMHWVMYQYNYVGVLYWNTVNYHRGIFRLQSHANHIYFSNPYEDSSNASKDPGEGRLFYPGRPYGIYGPVETIRLHGIRDGQEDYEYFYLLEKLYKDNGYDAKVIIDEIHNNIYHGMKSFADSKTFEKYRKVVANLILEAKKGIFKKGI